MYYLIAAIAANLCMIFLMKYSEMHNGNRYALNIWNYLAGTIVSFLLLEDKSAFLVNDRGFTLSLSVANGILFVVALVCIQLSILRNGAPLTTTFSRLGILIPMVLSAIFFAEIPGQLQLIGLGCCVLAIIFMNVGNSDERPAFPTGLILVFVLGGLVDFISKAYGRAYEKEAQTCFVMYTFIAALLVSIVLFVKHRNKMKLQDVLIGIGVGIPNQLTTLFLIRAASRLPAYIIYPTYSAGLILLVNMINFLIFREVLSKKQYFATAFIGLGLVLINL